MHHTLPLLQTCGAFGVTQCSGGACVPCGVVQQHDGVLMVLGGLRVCWWCGKAFPAAQGGVGGVGRTADLGLH
jgi:hypothetical protein